MSSADFAADPMVAHILGKLAPHAETAYRKGFDGETSYSRIPAENIVAASKR